MLVRRSSAAPGRIDFSDLPRRTHFAGLWERWKDKASGELVRSCTIVTTTPNELCAPIHDRMPVIVEPANYGKWLGEEPMDPMRL